MPPPLHPIISLFPAHPVPLTLGSDHTDADQQEEAEAQGEQEGAGAGEEPLQEGLEGRQPCKRRGCQDEEGPGRERRGGG